MRSLRSFQTSFGLRKTAGLGLAGAAVLAELAGRTRSGLGPVLGATAGAEPPRSDIAGDGERELENAEGLRKKTVSGLGASSSTRSGVKALGARRPSRPRTTARRVRREYDGEGSSSGSQAVVWFLGGDCDWDLEGGTSGPAVTDDAASSMSDSPRSWES